MIPGQPSRTLLTPAVARAAHQLFDAPLILDDPLAIGLVPETSREAILGSPDVHRTLTRRLRWRS
jgi:O-methyltransferase involved in polyketide biosynthesis